ncbi:hypothetical protein DNI29_20785 [Hymenobacter sediminis]|uniref:hypothetical protein n=1 Tax=Hymenobacter sediminis TaxID=2218621 RepID=UPI000DA6C29A|nr:hypothetical protein [Hymenobacter sediminis]RPD44571.1 hypothetical protein DNI29_20785 [Hymenobacter sediminis]
MDYSTDLSVVDWLQINEERIYGNRFLQVTDLLPNLFATYTALLPSVGIIEGFPFEQVNLKNPSIAQLNKNAAIWAEYGIYNAQYTPTYTPTCFSDLATQFNLPYNNTLLARLEWQKRGFAIQWEQTASNLMNLLKAVAPDSQLLLYVVDYYRWAAIDELPSADQVVYSITIAEYIEFITAASFDATCYLFPEDTSWCLVNVEDRSFPILGADWASSEAISSQSYIEKLPLSPETQV